MKYRHFIFDVDGTLLNTEKTGILSLQQTVRELTGRDMPYEELYDYFGLPSAKAAEVLGASDAKLFAETWETHFQELMHLVTVFPGVEEALAAVKAAGARLGIVTSRNRFELNYDPTLRKWASFFDLVVCSEDTVRHKPDPDPLLHYIKQMDALPRECIYIGDTTHDWQCAVGAGIDFALADWNGRGLRSIRPQYRVTKSQHIIDLI